MAAGYAGTSIAGRTLVLAAALWAVCPVPPCAVAAEGVPSRTAAWPDPADEGRRSGPEDIFAREFAVGRSTAELYAVFGSTSPEREAAGYLRRGIYRGELLMLYDIARRSGAPIKALVQEREKGVSLRVIAADRKADLMGIFREAAAVQREIESRTAAAEKAAMWSADVSTAAAKGSGVAVSTAAGGGHAP